MKLDDNLRKELIEKITPLVRTRNKFTDNPDIQKDVDAKIIKITKEIIPSEIQLLSHGDDVITLILNEGIVLRIGDNGEVL
jgi:hypothetical protein